MYTDHSKGPHGVVGGDDDGCWATRRIALQINKMLLMACLTTEAVRAGSYGLVCFAHFDFKESWYLVGLVVRYERWYCTSVRVWIIHCAVGMTHLRSMTPPTIPLRRCVAPVVGILCSEDNSKTYCSVDYGVSWTPLPPMTESSKK